MTHCTLHGRDDCDICRAIDAGQSGYTLQPQVSEFGELSDGARELIDVMTKTPREEKERLLTEALAEPGVREAIEDLVKPYKSDPCKAYPGLLDVVLPRIETLEAENALLRGKVATLEHSMRVHDERNAHVRIHGTPCTDSSTVEHQSDKLEVVGSSPSPCTAPAERVASTREVEELPPAYDDSQGGAPTEDRSEPPPGFAWWSWENDNGRRSMYLRHTSTGFTGRAGDAEELLLADSWALVDSLTRSAVERATEELKAEHDERAKAYAVTIDAQQAQIRRLDAELAEVEEKKQRAESQLRSATLLMRHIGRDINDWQVDNG